MQCIKCRDNSVQSAGILQQYIQQYIQYIHMSGISLMIDCHKIISWLEDRKKLQKDWYDYVKAAEEKIKLLTKDVELYAEYPHLQQLIRENHQSFHYCDVNKFVEELLKTKWAEQRSLMFGYSDKRVKEWMTLKKYMDGKMIGLLNTAKFIEQALSFDLPSINKSIQLMDGQLVSLRRKIDFNQNTIFQQKGEMEKEKDVLGIKKQQQQSIEDMVPILIKSGAELLQQYQQFLRDVKMQSYLAVFNEATAGSTLKMLQYLLEHGDEYLQVYKSEENRAKYQNVQKYREFTEWKPHNEWEIQIEGASNKEDQINSDLNPITILQNRQTRQQILFDLNELLFFFKGVKYEMANTEKGLGFQAESSKGTQMVEGDVVEAIQNIERSIGYLTNKKFVTIVELKNNKKFYQSFINQFLNYERNIAAMRGQIVTYRRQIEDLELGRVGLVEKLRGLRSKAVQSKNCCEKWLSQLIKKSIKITGEINKFE